MRKIITMVLMLVLVPMLFGSGVSRTLNKMQVQAEISNEVIGSEVPYFRGGRQGVLFVEDPAGTSTPMPDQYWISVLDSILGVGTYGLFGPTTTYAQNGPDLATMQPYDLVIWNCYDTWNPASGAALTATDRTNVASYLTGGGKVWLFGQDILWSGVPLAWLTTNFDLASASQDYGGGGFPSAYYWFNGLVEIAADTFQTMDDWGSDFFPDHLTPTANAHRILQDQALPSYYPAILRNNYTSSFWTVDGRGPPTPWQEWEDLVYTMLGLFGVIQPSHDVGTVSIDLPATLPLDTTLVPQATVKNFGDYSESFDVTCTIDPGGYTSTFNVVDLPLAESVQVIFPDSFTFASGFYTVTVYTQLGTDDNFANDTLVKVVEATGIAEGGAVVPKEFVFKAPTICKGRFNIEFSLPAATKVDLLVYDAVGRLSRTLISERFAAGTHRINANLDLTTGVYFYNLKTELGTVTKKFLIVE